MTKLSVSPGCKRLRFFLHNGKEHLSVKKYTISAALRKLNPVHKPTRPKITNLIKDVVLKMDFLVALNQMMPFSFCFRVPIIAKSVLILLCKVCEIQK